MTIDAPNVDQIPALRRLWKEAFGDTDEFLDLFYDVAYMPDHCRLITIEKEVVAALYWFDAYRKSNTEDGPKKKVAYIYAVATAKSHQGLGYCHKLMESTHQHLKENQYEAAVLAPANEKLFLLYQHMGYVKGPGNREFSCTKGREKIKLRRIKKEEYAGFRLLFLPEEGLVQEGKNMDFLDALAGFYAGEDILFAACEEKGKLRVVEFLGNEEKASDLLYTLGYEKGDFRTPGSENSFAMYLPLEENVPKPSYLGFVFD